VLKKSAAVLEASKHASKIEILNVGSAFRLRFHVETYGRGALIAPFHRVLKNRLFQQHRPSAIRGHHDGEIVAYVAGEQEKIISRSLGMMSRDGTEH